MNEVAGPEAAGWFGRLKAGLRRSAAALSDGVTALVAKRRLDEAALTELEELLIAADLGPAMAARIVGEISSARFGKEVSADEIRAALAESIAAILAPVEHAFDASVAPGAKGPHVALIVGANGSGKTTTIGKLAARFSGQGKKVVLAAGDTFRAAAIDQLKIWGERAGCPVIARGVGADSAGVAFDALKEAQAQGADMLLIDTAGRLHNKAHLMAELGKVTRVLKKLDPRAPHSTLLVLDATTGQNALAQVRAFRAMAEVSGLIMTKLDGTARGGVLVALAAAEQVPVHFVGVGEKIEDLQTFSATAFARALTGSS